MGEMYMTKKDLARSYGRRITKRLRWILLVLLAGVATPSVAAVSVSSKAPLYYHIFVRSFADSNGDRIGDLRGITSQLDYLESIHVSHILLTPIQASPFYHNYFATDFDKIEPAYGDEAAWFDFVNAAHARGIKVILDLEFQYVAEGHPWWKDHVGNPGKPFGNFVLWNRRDLQTEPEPFLTSPNYLNHAGQKVGIAMIDLNRDEVQNWFVDMMQRRVDPKQDGSLTAGVDGFRIDHMMDDLDNKKRVTNLFRYFWQPAISRLKQINPNLEFIAEQYDWGYGTDFLTRGGADAVFAFPLRDAINKFDKQALMAAVTRTAEATPGGKRQLVFVENHDVNRFATLVDSNPDKLRIGAVLNLTLGRDAKIYYGQELGMRGREITGTGSDGGHIPLREAFRWKADLAAPGSAIWYQGPELWWTQRSNSSGDGVSVQEQQNKSASLLGFYRHLSTLRNKRPELWRGQVELGCADDSPVFCYTRREAGRWTFVAINLSPRETSTQVPMGSGLNDLLTGRKLKSQKLKLRPWEVALIGSEG